MRRAMGFERVRHRTCIGRRLSGLVLEAEQQIALLGHRIVEEVKPEADQPKASAIDGRMYKAEGPKRHKSDRQKVLCQGRAKCRHRFQWPKSGYRGWVQDHRLVLQGLAFPHPVAIFATWRPNNGNEANITIEALMANKLKVTDVLLGDATFGGGPIPYLYEEAVEWVLSPKQLLQERRS